MATTPHPPPKPQPAAAAETNTPALNAARGRRTSRRTWLMPRMSLRRTRKIPRKRNLNLRRVERVIASSSRR